MNLVDVNGRSTKLRSIVLTQTKLDLDRFPSLLRSEGVKEIDELPSGSTSETTGAADRDERRKHDYEIPEDEISRGKGWWPD